MLITSPLENSLPGGQHVQLVIIIIIITEIWTQIGWREGEIIITYFFKTLGNNDPEGGLKIRKNYKKLGMSSNLHSHDQANCYYY